MARPAAGGGQGRTTPSITPATLPAPPPAATDREGDARMTEDGLDQDEGFDPITLEISGAG